jgi:hypothetical protein
MALGDFDGRWKNPQGNSNEQMYLWAQDLIKELRKGDYISNAIGTGITNSQLANMAAWTIKMRNNAAAGVPQDQTINDLTAETSVVGASDYIPMWDASAGEMNKATPDAIVGGLTNVPGFRKLTSGSVTNQATLDIVLTGYTSFRAIKFVLTSFLPVTDDVELWMRFSTDGGSNYDAGATDYAYAVRGLFNNGTSGDVASAGTTRIVLAGFTSATFAVSNVAGEGGVDADITLHDQTAVRFGRVLYKSGFVAAVSTNSTAVLNDGCGSRLTAQDTDAVRFLFESGNIASGNYAVYGMT